MDNDKHYLDQFEAPFLAEKLLEEGTFKDQEEFQVAFGEFKRYLLLSKKYPGKSFGMTSKKVDAIWHQFILFTKDYHLFCEQFFGHYLHHNPRTASRPLASESASNFRALYQKEFGTIPALWNAKSDCSECNGEGSDCDSRCESD